MKRDEATYGSIRRKFDEWKELEASRPERPRVQPPQRHYTPQPAARSEMGKTLFMGIGVGIGLVLLVLAGLSFANAAEWSGVARGGATVGYTLVGFFLVVAGLGGIAATLNHNLRVLPEAHRRQAHP